MTGADRIAEPDRADAPGPVEALREIGFWLERERAKSYRVKAYRGAADVVAGLSADELAMYQAAGIWQDLPGIGPKTAAVITQACAGQVPDYLTDLRRAAQPIGVPGKPLRTRLRGDLHTHSDWSDGGSPIAEMMSVAAALGHEYCALTDHSPRLTVANGLSAERLRRQLDLVAELNERFAPFRILTGIEVDILDDGTLDQEADLLAELDIVVASVHSHLRADSETMTKRMVYAVANPNVDVLGHCTGRLVTGGRGTRPESTFDAELVFEACKQYGTAVEINCRPERLDPPSRLLRLAVEIGCHFSVDTDAHAPGQLDWQGYGCERAVANGVDPDRVINTWPVDELLAWTAAS
ncbi:PHP domain-containing protein [Nocardia bhagyanarayanae]|uniref:Putative hydrolase n=1 Tax=Nocardia bhagyanarayanae TaxID=1215925 RepID=A0A543FC02_9NOCA|nr:PHP domain-containing protein [Nocardia bhagyanarayanae]TQM31367.1 putative hydrolase [Nocardia bhagyanarayanae]